MPARTRPMVLALRTASMTGLALDDLQDVEALHAAEDIGGAASREDGQGDDDGESLVHRPIPSPGHEAACGRRRRPACSGRGTCSG